VSVFSAGEKEDDEQEEAEWYCDTDDDLDVLRPAGSNGIGDDYPAYSPLSSIRNDVDVNKIRERPVRLFLPHELFPRKMGRLIASEDVGKGERSASASWWFPIPVITDTVGSSDAVDLDERTVADVEGKRGELAGLGVHDGLGVVVARWLHDPFTIPEEFGVLNPSACCILDS